MTGLIMGDTYGRGNRHEGAICIVDEQKDIVFGQVQKV